MRSVRRAIPVLAVSLCAAVLRAQDEEQLRVEGPQPGLVRLGERAVVRLQVVNPTRDPEAPSPPSVDGLRVRVSAPSQQTFQSVVGGRIWTERTVGYSIVLEPQRTGEFTIPRFRWNTGSREQPVGPLSLRVVEDPKGEELGFVRAAASPSRVYVNEPLTLRVDFGVDADLRLAQGVTRGGQPYHRVDVRAPWMTDLPGAVPIEEPRERSNLFLVLNDHAVRTGYEGEKPIDGQVFHHFALTRTFLPTRTGVLELPRPVLSFTVLTGRDRRDVFGGRIPGQETEYFAYGEPLTVEVVPLPEEGRPVDFTGAVGRFELEAGIDRREVRVGDSVKLTFTVSGEGNLEFLGLPELPETDGWHVLGRTENRDDDAARVTFDLTPLRADAPPLPGVEWSFFDTNPGVERYVTVSTEPIAVEVEPLPDEERLAPLPGSEERPLVPGVDDIHDIFTVEELVSEPAARVPTEPSAVARIVAVLAPWVIVVFGAFALRAWRRRRADTTGRRARGARRTFDKALADGASPDAALCSYLAARLGVQEAAIVSPDLAERLRAAGVDAQLADGTQRAIDQGVAARYGGGEALSVEDARSLVARLEKTPVRRVATGLALLFVLAAGQVHAQSAVAEAERAYRDGDYAQAAVLYRTAAERGEADRRLWFNVGDAYYRTGQYAEALAAWERARVAMPRDAELRANIALARRQLGISGEGDSSFTAALDEMREATTAGERLLACVVLHLLAALLVVFGRGVVVRGLGVIVAIPALLLTIEVLWLEPERPARGIVLTPEATVVAEPREGLEPLFQVRAGLALDVLSRGDTWTRVRVGGRDGYVPSRALAVVD